MNTPADPSLKTRLTDPSAMVSQVKALLQKGFKLDDIAPELSKLYYVDVDLLNAVLRIVRKKRAPVRTREGQEVEYTKEEQDRAAA